MSYEMHGVNAGEGEVRYEVDIEVISFNPGTSRGSK